jgi:hypothetical protein
MKSFRSLVNENQLLKSSVLLYGHNFDKSRISETNALDVAHDFNAELTVSDLAQPIVEVAQTIYESGVKHLIIANYSGKCINQYKIVESFNNKIYHFQKITLVDLGEVSKDISGIREAYLAEQYLPLRSNVIDTHTGLTGKIVYRGPTYVTVQVNEDLSFKRWIGEVKPIKEEDNKIMSFLYYSTRDQASGQQLANANKELLSGQNKRLDPTLTQNNQSTMRKIKNFRKMED